MNESNQPVFVGNGRSQLFELDRVEFGLWQIMTNQGIPAQHTRDLGTNVTPRVELKLETESVQTQRYALAGETNSVFCPLNTWNFKLGVTVVTNRQQNGDNHLPLVGLARWNCQMFVLKYTWTPQINPYHRILEMREDSSSPDVWDEGGNDFTKMSFAGMFSILDTAW